MPRSRAICAACMCRGSASARRPDRGTRDWRGRLTPEAGLRTGHAAMRAMAGLCALGHGLPDDRLTLRRSMQCWSAHAVSLRDACKPLQAFMAVNVAAPRSSVKMCEKPARRHPTTDSGASSAHIIRPLRDPVAADQEQASLSAWRMIAANLVIRHPRADERADWEPLWKGYQSFHLKNSSLVLLAFRL